MRGSPSANDETRDMGLIPEPILEDVGREKETSTWLFSRRAEPANPAFDQHHRRRSKRQPSTDFAKSPDPSTRYWAAVWLGVTKVAASKPTLLKLTSDPVPTVRVAAAQALCKFGDLSHMKILVEHIQDRTCWSRRSPWRHRRTRRRRQGAREAMAAAQKVKIRIFPADRETLDRQVALKLLLGPSEWIDGSFDK